VLRRIFGSKREKVVGGSRKMRWGHIAYTGQMTNAYKNFVHEHGNEPLGSIKGRKFLD